MTTLFVYYGGISRGYAINQIDFCICITQIIQTWDENLRIMITYYSAAILQICFMFIWLHLQLFSFN